MERAFRPAVAAVIAFIDPQANMKLLQSSPETGEVWIKIFAVCDELGLTFERLIKAAPNKAPTSVSIVTNVLKQ